jgi:hypothetical protein
MKTLTRHFFERAIARQRIEYDTASLKLSGGVPWWRTVWDKLTRRVKG